MPVRALAGGSQARVCLVHIADTALAGRGVGAGRTDLRTGQTRHLVRQATVVALLAGAETPRPVVPRITTVALR